MIFNQTILNLGKTLHGNLRELMTFNPPVSKSDSPTEPRIS